MQKCNSLLRRNERQLDKQLTNLSGLEAKTKSMIKASAKRGDASSARILAKEIYHVRQQRSRLFKSKAQLQSVGMQVREAFAVRRIQGSMQASTGIMRDVNTLVRLPELSGTMRQLSQELMKVCTTEVSLKAFLTFNKKREIGIEADKLVFRLE